MSDAGFSYKITLPPTDVDCIDVLCDLFVNQRISCCEAETTTYPVRVDLCVAAVCLDGRISICLLSDELDC